MIFYIFKLIGGVGLVLIISGILIKSNTKQNLLFAAGGVLLMVYSFYLKDIIFIALQLFLP